MNRFIILFSLFALLSCGEKPQKNDISRKCSVSISLYGAPWEDQFSALYNFEDKYGDSLIVAKHTQVNEKDTTFYKKIQLKTIEQDTLYSLFSLAKHNFQLTDNQKTIMDGTKVRISIASPTQSLAFMYSSLKNAESASPEIGRLVKFINRRLPKDFQMY